MNSGLQGKASNYYPPRARWYTRLFLVPGARARRRLHLEKFQMPGALSLTQFFLALAVPGFAFFVLGRRILGRLLVAGYALGTIVFVVGLGYPVSSLAFGLMMSVHATSIIFLESLWLAKDRFGVRLFAGFCTMLAVWGLLYAPALSLVENHWLIPLRMGNQVLVVKRTAGNSLHRGDRVAYKISEERAWSARENRVYVRAGFGIQPVLALPGDHVRFEHRKVFVNDRSFAAVPYMPEDGEFVVSEKTWFVWPAFDINLHGAIAQSDISGTFQQLAMVPEKEIIGKAFRYWFWRRQTL